MHACDLAALHYMRYRVHGGAQHLQLGVLLKLVSGQSSAKGRPPKDIINLAGGKMLRQQAAKTRRTA